MHCEISKPSEEEVGRLKEELQNWDRHPWSQKLIKVNGQLWLLKDSKDEECKKREILAWRLARSMLNVPEVKAVTDADVKQFIASGLSVESKKACDMYLVRLAQGYDFEELNVSDLNQAAAGELIFSTWIRRRDAHLYNKVYVEGIPIFFDHHVGFLAEPELEDIDFYFNESQPKYWKVVIAEKPLTTAGTRQRKTARRYARSFH